MKCCKSAAAATTQQQPKPRRMSFTSASMAMGAFPPEKNVADPIINTVLLYASAEQCPSEVDLLPVAREFLSYERLSGIPTGTVGKADWTVEKSTLNGGGGGGVDVDPAKMIRTLSCHGEEELHQLLEDHLQDSLREGRAYEGLPWWEWVIIKNKGKGRSAIVFRLEHFIGDGLSLVTLFGDFLKFPDGSIGWQQKRQEQQQQQKMRSKGQQRDGAMTTAWKAVGCTMKALSLPNSKYDDDIVFRNGVGKEMVHTGRRKALIFHPYPLAFIKELKSAAGVTVNDILFTAFSQAVHDYSAKRDCAVLKQKGTKVQCRALMPFAFPRSVEQSTDKTRALCNKWVFVSSDMSMGHSNVQDRLESVHKTMSKLKRSPMAYVQLKIQESIPPKLPVNLARQAVFDSFSRHSVVWSNVPGVAELVEFPPSSSSSDKNKTFVVEGVYTLFNNLIPQVNVISYAEDLWMTVVLDPVAVSQSETLEQLFHQALVDLAEGLNVKVPSLILDVLSKGKKGHLSM